MPVLRFHYGGALIVVDLLCAPSEPVEDPPGRRPGQARGRAYPDELTAPVDTLGQAVEAKPQPIPCRRTTLLSGWGIASEPALSAVPWPGRAAVGFFAGALMPCYNLFDKVNFYLTFGEGSRHHREPRRPGVRRNFRCRRHGCSPAAISAARRSACPTRCAWWCRGSNWRWPAGT
ncbi:MAG: hypothetical protein R3D59_05660 [Paracoccaceae bacterium]